MLSFSQITINESDKITKSNNKTFIKKEINYTQSEANQVKQAIKKMNMREEFEVCDCKVVLKKTIDYDSTDERASYFECKKLLNKYKIETNAGLIKWNEDEKKGGCLQAPVSKKIQSDESEVDLLCNCYLLLQSGELQNQPDEDLLKSCQKLFIRFQLNTNEGKVQIERILNEFGCFN